MENGGLDSQKIVMNAKTCHCRLDLLNSLSAQIPPDWFKGRGSIMDVFFLFRSCWWGHWVARVSIYTSGVRAELPLPFRGQLGPLSEQHTFHS